MLFVSREPAVSICFHASPSRVLAARCESMLEKLSLIGCAAVEMIERENQRADQYRRYQRVSHSNVQQYSEVYGQARAARRLSNLRRP